MTDAESLAARRHRVAYAIRHASSVDAGACLLEGFDGNVPWELCEFESLPDWRYETLLAHVVQRRAAPTFEIEGRPSCVMRAEDVLDCRRYELIGLLAVAAEQAFELGDAKAAHAMSGLCQTACVRVIGVATMRLAFGSGEDKAGEG